MGNTEKIHMDMMNLIYMILLYVDTYAPDKPITKGLITMRNKEDLKTVRRTVLMTQSTADDIDREAEERGIKANSVMNERLDHPERDNTPAKMVEFQNFANEAVHLLAQHSPDEAKYLETRANKLWTF